MDYPKVCLRRGEEAGVLKGQKLIYDNELDRRGRRWAFPTRAGWSSASRTGCRG